MGFFAGRPRIASSETRENRPAQPEWFGPPRGVLAGYAPTRAVLLQTEQAVLVVSRFDAYPTGVEFTLELQLRDPDADFMNVPWELHRRRGDGGPRASRRIC